MNLKVEIDSYSGFCNGVVNAINKAEHYLASNGKLFSLGAIVHNQREIARLEKDGLEIIDIEKMKTLNGGVVLVRAHGEPPTTYALAEKNGIDIIDCTCPVVLKLQERIGKAYMKARQNGGQIVIFGKTGHAEVNGLVGQTDGNAIVVENLSDIEKIDFNKPLILFSQTTKDPEEYQALINAIKNRKGTDFIAHNTICRQVASRHEHLVEFAKSNDVILFVSGHESSNGRVLFELCKSNNPRCFWVESKEMIEKDWFNDGEKVGICGATSTPRWQLEEIYYICSNLD